MADDPVAELYGLPLEGFVPARNELARDLRKGGDKERAADVAKLKRPSVAAWTVNQLARSNRKELDLLLDAGHRLRTGQVEALEKGDPTKFEAARRDHERAVRDLVGAARELLASERGVSSDQMVASVERTLRYASIDEEQRPVLASGRLVDEVEATGFDAFAGMVLAPTEAPARGKTKKGAGGKREDATQRRKRVAAAQASLDQARERERGARDVLREAERSERAAARALDRATADVAAAREALEAASAESREAADRLEAER